MTKTPYTAQSRRKAKQLLALFKSDKIQIWTKGQGFQVMTFERPGFCYGSDVFATKAEAFCHIVKRAASTAGDLKRFDTIAARYFRRFLAA